MLRKTARPSRLLLAWLLPFWLLLAGCGSGESAQDREFRGLLDRYHQEDMALFPSSASHYGRPTDDRAWDPVSNAFLDQHRRRLEARLEAVRAIDAAGLNEANRLSHQLYALQLRRSLEADGFRHHDYIAHNFWGPHTNVPSFLINVHQVADVADAENYIARVRGVKPLFEDVAERMRLAADQGVFLPDWSYPLVIDTAVNAIGGRPFDDGEDSVILADLRGKVERLDIVAAEKARLLAEAEAALVAGFKPGYEAFIAEARRQQALAPAQDGVWKHPRGAAFYQERLRHFTTLDMSAEEIHALGLREVARIHQEMDAIRSQVGFAGSLQEFMVFMREDEQFYYPDTDAGRAGYMEKAKALLDAMYARLPDAFGTLPKTALTVKRIEAFRERSAASKALYFPTDGSRPGIYYINLYNMKSMPIYQMEALAYHEGVPGHHMQIAIAAELEGLPEFQKHASFTAYVEGWGLYSEQLGKELGFYQDPYSEFGRLAWELWRACRLVVDTGLHDRRWSKEQAIRYLVDNTPNSVHDSTNAIRRYAVMPGQATAYLIGKLKIVELREAARAALGERFDLRAFHDEVLKDGPVPLSVLTDKIERWTDRQQQN